MSKKKNKNKNKQSMKHIEINGNKNNLKQSQIKSGNNIDKSTTNKNITIFENFNKIEDEFETLDRYGLQYRENQTINCKLLLTDNKREVRGVTRYTCVNLCENGKLVADHMHVNFGDYLEDIVSDFLEITGVIKPYPNDSKRMEIEITVPPNNLEDVYITTKVCDINKFYDISNLNRKLILTSKENMMKIIEYLRFDLNSLTKEFHFGNDFLYNYIMTQISLNSHNSYIYTDKLEKFDKVILYLCILCLSSTIRSLKVLTENQTIENAYGEKSLYNILRDIILDCNCLQEINVNNGIVTTGNGFNGLCERLNVKYKKVFTNVITNRNNNFNIQNDKIVDFNNERRPFDIINEYKELI